MKLLVVWVGSLHGGHEAWGVASSEQDMGGLGGELEHEAHLVVCDALLPIVDGFPAQIFEGIPRAGGPDGLVAWFTRSALHGPDATVIVDELVARPEAFEIFLGDHGILLVFAPLSGVFLTNKANISFALCQSVASDKISM